MCNCFTILYFTIIPAVAGIMLIAKAVFEEKTPQVIKDDSSKETPPLPECEYTKLYTSIKF